MHQKVFFVYMHFIYIYTLWHTCRKSCRIMFCNGKVNIVQKHDIHYPHEFVQISALPLLEVMWSCHVLGGCSLIKGVQVHC
jgi:hypothetical protein